MATLGDAEHVGGVSGRLADLVGEIAALPDADTDGERIDRIGLLDKIKAAASAAQAVETTRFAASQRAQQEDDGVPARRVGRGIAEQIGLARKTSPTGGSHQLRFAERLTGDLPHTFKLLATGQIGEWVAMIVARETTELSEADRRRVDADLAEDLPAMSARRAEAAARRHACDLDPEAALRRARTARTDRGVSIRPAPDTMARLTGFLPCEQGVAAYASLDRHARAAKAAGDARSLGQLRADAMVERLTGQATADAVSAEIGLVMDADTLLDTDETPAALAGYGPIPAQIARQIATGGHTASTGTDSNGTDSNGGNGAVEDLQKAHAFLRRLFTDPVDQSVAHIDTRRRRFDGTLAKLIAYRDQHCADPFCDAPIRHLDHRTPHRNGGPTTATNGQGRCERGNYVKEMPRWRIELDPDNPTRTVVTTPTGHTYTTRPPPALGPGANRNAISHRRMIRRLAHIKRERLIHDLPSP